ncbi:hypothetical protein CHS0354_009596 [Potamilus streckersoni]|uniref:Uncharacterized protein n=1 Tax=Potamilus streckersoni TaxID=2493646 RepID=A0AAE0SPI0_9BIVA|nr:hypothetical protein CHS0354_009596 [Potamilus streckersoni]
MLSRPVYRPTQVVTAQGFASLQQPFVFPYSCLAHQTKFSSKRAECIVQARRGSTVNDAERNCDSCVNHSFTSHNTLADFILFLSKEHHQSPHGKVILQPFQTSSAFPKVTYTEVEPLCCSVDVIQRPPYPHPLTKHGVKYHLEFLYLTCLSAQRNYCEKEQAP